MTGEIVSGTGVDLVENERVRDLIAKWGHRFTDKVFLPRERKYCESKALPWLHYAGRIAVKEAVVKALETGISPEIGWLDIEVERNDISGAPTVRLSGRGQKAVEARKVKRIMISLSHTRNHAIAYALLVAAAEC
ncbi:MAG: holo-ACP synthase [Kiritimatiellia bacterium]